MKKNNKITLALFFALCCMPVLLYAGSFNVVPIKIYFDANRKIENLKITNETERKASFQIRAFSWTQDENGADRNDLTNELIFYPKIFTVEKGEERLIKVSYASKPDNMEKTYRLFLEEIPQDAKSDTNQLKIALRLGVPVFIAPQIKTKEAGGIEKMSFDSGKLSFLLRNKGNTHFFMKDIVIQGFDDKGEAVFTDRKKGWYLLAGRTKHFSADIPAEMCMRIQEIVIQVDTNTFSVKDKLSVSKSMCKG